MKLEPKDVSRIVGGVLGGLAAGGVPIDVIMEGLQAWNDPRAAELLRGMVAAGDRVADEMKKDLLKGKQT